jgi:hypothetical protein
MESDEDSFLKNKSYLSDKILSFGEMKFYSSDDGIFVQTDFDLDDISVDQKKEFEDALSEFLSSEFDHTMSSAQPQNFEIRGWAGLIIDIFMSPNDAYDFRTNLEEFMPQWIARHGEKKAHIILGFNIIRGLLGKLENKIKLLKDILYMDLPKMD